MKSQHDSSVEGRASIPHASYIPFQKCSLCVLSVHALKIFGLTRMYLCPLITFLWAIFHKLIAFFWSLVAILVATREVHTDPFFS